MPRLRARRLPHLEVGQSGELVRVDDTDPAVLRQLAQAGIGLGADVRLLGRSVGGSFRIGVDGMAHDLDAGLAGALWIDRTAAAGDPA